MKNFKLKVINFIFILSFVIFVFAAGYKLGESKSISTFNLAVTDRQSPVTDFTLFWNVWSSLEKKYVDKKKLDANKMYYGAIKGMVAALEDPYTFFLTPDENKQSKDDLQGKFEGIGAQLGLKEKRIVVIAPLKNSPAERAGVKAGDLINEVDGKSTAGWTLPQAVSKIRGEKGTKVELTLERAGKEFEVVIVRDQIIVSSVELEFENNVAILKLNQFGENTVAEWDNAVSQIKTRWENKQIKGMVLDLRDNPGGYLDGSVYLASEFLSGRKLIVKQESTVNTSREYYVEKNGQLLDIPLVVLINKGSASASEILAGSLRDHKRAKLVGEKSFGKGSVQEALDLRDGSGLHVTVAKWILPAGDWINSKGIEPEIKVELETEEGTTTTRETDNQLEKAIEILLK